MSETNESLPQNVPPASSAQEPPGSVLKRERERQGLTLETVSEQLNLRPAVVAGLEQDRYDQVPIVAYRRGYLRAYARLLGIDEREVVEAYNALHGRSDGERKVSTVQPSRRPSRVGAWIFRLVTLLVILGLIALTLLWWQSREGNDLFGLGRSEPVSVDTLDGETITEGGEAADIPTERSSQPTSEAQSDASEARAGEPVHAADSAIAEGSNASASITDSDTASAVGTSENSGTTVANADNLGSVSAPSGAPVSDNTSAPSDATSAAASDEASATAQDEAEDTRTLSLTFNEQSWTEIYDANNRRIFVGLQSAGTQASAEGEPPFRLTIGNASGVELRYQGQRVDLTSRAGGNNVARFTLGE
ncbi:helix-turn-helix domain-containing protein [Halomonas shantousis]